MQLGKVIGQAAQVKAVARNWAPSLTLLANSCCQLVLGSFSDLMLAPRSSAVSMSSYKVRYSPVAVTSLTAVAGTPMLAAIVLVVEHEYVEVHWLLKKDGFR